MAIMPTTAQYTANQISLPLFTILIINLQAKHPTVKAVIKPQIKGSVPIEPNTISPPATYNSISPKIGASTIRNEN